MSTEQLGSINISTPERLRVEDKSANKKKLETDTKKRVDINTLMNKVREERKKENKNTLVLFSLIVSVIGVFGVILSF
tara:strand:+ start:275 stop:508 length:234 start_codon:yes stop_codon:yes gene_type:complete